MEGKCKRTPALSWDGNSSNLRRDDLNGRTLDRQNHGMTRITLAEYWLYVMNSISRALSIALQNYLIER